MMTTKRKHCPRKKELLFSVVIYQFNLTPNIWQNLPTAITIDTCSSLFSYYFKYMYILAVCEKSSLKRCIPHKQNLNRARIIHIHVHTVFVSVVHYLLHER